eukprot:TRINITY_DN14249_c0_g1_i1.p1 TRINITY_DN14249_c0_g1~~TRINITY_DN14249_c0_g1_i1.p1  ORF type:complete len:468 (+),score=89.49 TRINITY_DN14249_c0_g1_i1:35-1405(+)
MPDESDVEIQLDEVQPEAELSGGLFDDVDLTMLPFVQEDLEEDDEAGAEEMGNSGEKQPQQIARKGSKGRLEKSQEYSLTKAAFHIFKGNVGAAIFSLASAYVKSGFIMGTVILVCLAVICVHCMLLLVKCKQTLNDPNVQSYGQVVCSAFGRRGKHLVDVFVCITQLGFCCVYFQFAAGMLHKVLPSVGVTEWIVVMVPIATLLTFLPNMKKLVPAAIFATLATLLSLVILYGFSFEQIASKAVDRSVVPIASIWTMPVCVGNTISAFEGIGLVLPIENSVRDKSRFPSLLIISFVIISFLYVTFGLVGYLAYASTLTNSITDVVPSGWLSGVVRLGMAVAILLTYPLQFFPAVQIIEGWMFERRSRYQALQLSVKNTIHIAGKLSLIWHNLTVRIAVSVSLALLAIIVGDQMSLFLALIGGMGGSALAVIIPPMLHLKSSFSGRTPRSTARWSS